MHATVFSGSILGVNGFTVEVEVDISRGIPSFSIVGLPNTAVRESRERVTAAIKNSGWEFPLQRITVNLAPADIRKEGAAFDLAIAMGIIAASADDRTNAPTRGPRREAVDSKSESGRPATTAAPPEALALGDTIFLGELALDGCLRKVRGVLPVLIHARSVGFARAVIPHENFSEALVVDGIEVFGCRRLSDAVSLFAGADHREMSPGAPAEEVLHKRRSERGRPKAAGPADDTDGSEMGDVIGQESAKRALLVAAAGGHHVLMIGPPGAGKTMLARRFPSMLPPLEEQAALETTMIYSIVGLLDGGLITRSPFRSPHHSASDAGLIGGGNVPRPGEVTLAHNGVLFLDELPEFKRHVLETLREPLEEGRITISRAKSAVTFPARFQLIAAMNPCPCGYLGSPDRTCHCSPPHIERYLSKISGPLLDRIAIHVFVRPVEIGAFRQSAPGETSESFLEAVCRAREVQRRRLGDEAPFVLNARLPAKLARGFCALEEAGETLLFRAQKTLRVSARGRAHILRVARTIADLEGAKRITAAHVAEAVQYRMREVPA